MATETVQLGTRVPAALHKALTALARRENTSITHEVTLALRAHVDTHRAKGK